MKFMIRYFLWLPVCLTFVLTACEKEKIPYYNDVERVNFNYTSMGLPVSYTHLTLPTTPYV